MQQDDRLQLLPGTLEMLVLQTLVFGSRHGHGIATTIQRTSDELLLVDHGSLYPALQRLERAGLISQGRQAQTRPRRLQAARLRDVADWIEPYRRLWDERFDRFGAYLKKLQAKEKPHGRRK